MIKHLLGRRRGRKKEKIIEKIEPPKAVPYARLQSNISAPDIRQNVVKDHSYPFLLAAQDGTQNKIWIEAETYYAALLRAQGIAELMGANVVEIW